MTTQVSEMTTQVGEMTTQGKKDEKINKYTFIAVSNLGWFATHLLINFLSWDVRVLGAP